MKVKKNKEGIKNYKAKNGKYLFPSLFPGSPLLIRVPGKEKERALGTRLTHCFQEYDIKRSVRNIETLSYIL